MSEQLRRRRRNLIKRAARVAFAFVLMNVAAVSGLLSVTFRRKVWR